MAADYPVGYAHSHKRLLDKVRLRIHTVEDCKIAVFAAVSDAVENFISDIEALVTVGFRDMIGYRRAGAVIRPKIFALAVCIVCNDAVCGVQNILS